MQDYHITLQDCNVICFLKVFSVTYTPFLQKNTYYYLNKLFEHLSHVVHIQYTPICFIVTSTEINNYLLLLFFYMIKFMLHIHGYG